MSGLDKLIKNDQLTTNKSFEGADAISLLETAFGSTLQFKYLS